jgi:hypothetical protein
MGIPGDVFIKNYCQSAPKLKSQIAKEFVNSMSVA